MKNKQKLSLRVQLRQNKKLQAQLDKTIGDSEEAIMLRKELGTSTLKDILGDRYPIRVCRHCGRRAYSDNDLWAFVEKREAKYDRDNCCTDCKVLLSNSPGVKIVGEYCELIYKKQCVKCKRQELPTKGERSWFLPRATICKECLGTHSNAFGYPLKIDDPLIIYTWHGLQYLSVRALSDGMNLSYYATRTLVITDKINTHPFPY